VTEHFHPEYDSPLWHAEVLYEGMADSQFHSHIPPGPGLLQASGQQSLRPGFTAEEGLKGRFAINLGTSNDRPTVRDGKPAPPTDTVEKFVPIGTVGYRDFIKGADMYAELARIGEQTGVTSGK
jgi:hypothetical protein